MNNIFRFNIGQRVHIAPDRFPQEHRPTMGNLYTVDNRSDREEEEWPQKGAGNYYSLKEVPSGVLHENDISEA